MTSASAVIGVIGLETLLLSITTYDFVETLILPVPRQIFSTNLFITQNLRERKLVNVKIELLGLMSLKGSLLLFDQRPEFWLQLLLTRLLRTEHICSSRIISMKLPYLLLFPLPFISYFIGSFISYRDNCNVRTKFTICTTFNNFVFHRPDSLESGNYSYYHSLCIS